MLKNLIVAAAALAFAAPALADRGHGNGRHYDKPRHYKAVHRPHHRPIVVHRPVVVVPPRHVHYHPPVRVYHAPVRVYHPPVYRPVVHPLAPLLSIRFDFPL